MAQSSSTQLGITKKQLKAKKRKYTIKLLRKHWQFYILLLLPILYVIIFKYGPMYGAQIAFKDYQFRLGIWGSPWLGFKYFKQFFQSPQFMMLIKNTLGLSVYGLIAGFPMPIILALCLNEIKAERFKKLVQQFTYAPYFISTVVMVSIVLQFLDPRLGVINNILREIGLVDNVGINFIGEARYFRHVFVWSGIWQYTGYNAIIYIAALSGIDPNLYEAAQVDGASKLQRILHVDLPGITPTIVILLILNAGRIMNVGFEKVYLLQNNMNLSKSEIIATYVYKIGLEGAQFSFSTAIGLFNAVINLILIASVNRIAKRFGETSLW